MPAPREPSATSCSSSILPPPPSLALLACAVIASARPLRAQWLVIAGAIAVALDWLAALPG